MELGTIIIKSGDRIIKFRPEEAKEMQKLLNDLFPGEIVDESSNYLKALREIIREEMPKDHPYPYYPIWPHYTDWYRQRPWIEWTITDAKGYEGNTTDITYTTGECENAISP